MFFWIFLVLLLFITREIFFKLFLCFLNDRIFEKYFLEMLKFSQEIKNPLMEVYLIDRWEKFISRMDFNNFQELVFYLRAYPDDLFWGRIGRISEVLGKKFPKMTDNYDEIIRFVYHRNLKGVVDNVFLNLFLEKELKNTKL